jgi:glutathione S-transferase
MLTVYGCPNSRSMRMVWALEEAGADYAYILIDLFRGAGRSPDFLKINPAGKVPALVNDGVAMTESGAILLWLAERYPEAPLMPQVGDSVARAEALQWLMFALTELEPPLWAIAKHRFVLPESRRSRTPADGNSPVPARCSRNIWASARMWRQTSSP